MRPNYLQWLAEQKYTSNVQSSQMSRVKKIEECYGDLDEHVALGTYQAIIDSMHYSTADERGNRPNPSKIKIEGSLYKGLQAYKSAVVLYRKFLQDAGTKSDAPEESIGMGSDNNLISIEERQQRFSLERDMQAALRHNITSLDPALRIIDDGAERAVGSGLIDITCEDGNGIVIIELKAGRADSRAIGQILGYMGDVQEEEEKPVRGILVAHDFDRRAKSAARVVPNLMLQRYAIAFNFTREE